MGLDMDRRGLLRATALAVGGLGLPGFLRSEEGLPTDDPTAALELDWTATLAWNRAISILSTPGGDWDGRLETAQDLLAARGGGVVYFPAGTYAFRDHVRLRDAIVLRGEPPRGVTVSGNERYALATRFVFPRYEVVLDGDGGDVGAAFKGIRLADPERASHCGLVHIDVDFGHIHLGEGENHRCGRNRLVYGCILRHCAVPDPAVPDPALGQHPWQ
ncbi:MAG: hypothetical protein JXR77_02955, partial [Lentisphaeria bacterium]|nr:hypothetical protein [Lentisphaeria bacterium]